MNPLLGLLLRVPLHGLGLLVTFLPRSAEMRLGPWLGRLYRALDFKRRRIVEENVARCWPELSEAQRRRIIRENYDHYGTLGLELLHMLSPVPGHWRRYAERTAVAEGVSNVAAAHAKGKGVIFISGHFANWELMAAGGGLNGAPNIIVTRRLKPAWLMDWFLARRLETGTECLLEPRTMPGTMKALKANKAVGWVLDQYMNPPAGAPMRFFGARVNTLAAVAPLARRMGAAVIPVYQRREPDGRVRIVFLPEFRLAGDDDGDNQRMSDWVESIIREAPGQWLWAHRRFKGADWSYYRERKAQPS